MSITLPEIDPFTHYQTLREETYLGATLIINAPDGQLEECVTEQDGRFTPDLVQLMLDSVEQAGHGYLEKDFGVCTVRTEYARVTDTKLPYVFISISFTKDAICSIVDQDSFEAVAGVLGYEVRNIVFTNLYGEQRKALRSLISEWRKNGKVGPQPTLDYTKPALPEEN